MNRLVPLLLIVAAALFAWAPFLIRDVSPDATLGVVQKIFYYHVGVGITMMVVSMVSAGASAWYLVRRTRGADNLAFAAAEVAVVLGIIVLTTGPLWARKSWGHWWIWDARTTSTLVMWMILSSYLLLRRYGGLGSETLAAAVGVFAGVMAPLVYKAVDIWRTQHPTTDVTRTLPPDMRLVFRISVLAFFVLAAALIALRARIAAAQHALDDLHLAVED